MKLLFIGGTGRLSKDTVARAVEQGHEVTLLTRGSKARDAFVLPGAEMLTGDIRNPQSVRDALGKRTFDAVADYLTFNPEQLGSNLDLLASRCGQYLFISTATVYKRSDENELVTEGVTELGNKNWKYAYDKYRCEGALRAFYDEHPGSFTIVRPYVTYGNTRVPYPIVPTNSLKEWTLVDRVLRGGAIPVFDGANALTTLTHARDFAKGITGLFGNEAALNEDFHITADPTTSWVDVLDVIESKIGIEVKRMPISQEALYAELPEYRPILVGDKGSSWKFDNSKIRSAVPEFDCTISTENGVCEMIDFYEAHSDLKVFDHEWNGKIDRLCEKHGIGQSVDYSDLTTQDMKAYKMGKSSLRAGAKRLGRRVKAKIGH